MCDLSIIITTYNYSNYIRECVLSCVEQFETKLDHEVIVVDDGSTDQTDLVLSGLSFPNLKKFRIDNSGIEVASNYGFSKAKGKYVVRVDADDKLFCNFLNKIEPILNSDAVFYYSNYIQVDSHGNEITKINLPLFDKAEIFERGDFLATGTVYLKDAIKKVGFYSTTEKNTGLENYDLVLRLLSLGGIGIHIDDFLFCYRRHQLNLSELKREEIIKNGKKLFQNKNYGVFKTNNFHPYGLVL